MQSQKRETTVSQTPIRKFTKAELHHLNNLNIFGKEEFGEMPHPVQAECMAYHYWYLDMELNLSRVVQHLDRMQTHFLQMSKDQGNLDWAVHFHNAHVLNRIKIYFQEMQNLKLGLQHKEASHPA